MVFFVGLCKKPQIDQLSRWRVSALERSRRAADLYQRRWDKAQATATSGARQLLDLQCQLIAQPDLPTPQLKQRLQQQKDRLQTEVDRLKQAAYRADRNRRDQWDKAASHTLKLRKLLRQRDDLEAQARQMYQLDDRQDQLMTTLRLALTNLIMWTRDQFFPANFAQATWKRLAPFFRLPGHIIDHPDRQVIFLRPFNDRQLNRDLHALCEQVNALKPRLPDGRWLCFLPYQSLSLISDAPT